MSATAQKEPEPMVVEVAESMADSADLVDEQVQPYLEREAETILGPACLRRRHVADANRLAFES